MKFMKPSLINHPLKRIHPKYNAEAALSDFETTFIERYKLLQDELATIKAQLLQLKPTIKGVFSLLQEVRQAFDKLNDKITRTALVLGIGFGDDIAPNWYKVRPGEIQHMLDEFQSLRKNYWLIMEPMHHLFTTAYERFAAFDDTVELFEKEFSEALLYNFENMDIDSSCFDNDMNKFREEWTALADLQEKCLDDYNEWAKQQTQLVNDSDALYDRIEKLFQHIHNILNFNSGKEGIQFGLN